MPVPPLHVLVLAAAILGALPILGLAALAAWSHFGRFLHPVIPAWVHPGVEHRRCRYCRLGRAYVHDERADIEGDDLVEVRCFVCVSCGLPQWSISRSAVVRKAA